VAKFVVIQILGLVKDERTFLTLMFMNTRLQNQLHEHGFGGSHVCITFHYDDVIIVKINEKTRRGF